MTTFIDTKQCRRVQLADADGEVAEIVNRELCGAENVVGMLRWLGQGDDFEAEPLANTHQLVYLMEGSGVINLKGKDYEVAKGAGIYLGPSESAGIRQAGSAPLKLLHLVAPKIAESDN
jgi:hypothetical protein